MENKEPKKKKKFRWWWVPVIFLCITCLVCSPVIFLLTRLLPVNEASQLQADDTKNTIKLKESTQILSESTTESILSVSDDNKVYVFDGLPDEVKELSVGDVFVSGISSATPYGSLQRVQSVLTDDGEAIVTTETATLEDAIEYGEFDVSHVLTPEDDLGEVYLAPGVTLVRQPGINDGISHNRLKNAKMSNSLLSDPFLFRLDNNILYDHDGDWLTTDDQILANGYVEMTPKINFIGKISGGNVQDMHLGVEMEQTIDLEIGGKLSHVYLEEEIVVARIMPRVGFLIGPVPVVITLPITFSVGIDGVVTGEASMHVTGENIFFIGARKNGSEWIPVAKNTFQKLTADTPIVSLNQELTGYVAFRIAFLLYGITGIDGQVREYITLEANTSEVPWWTLSRGADIGIGLRIDFLSPPVYIEFPTIELAKEILNQADSPFTGSTLPAETLSEPTEKGYQPIPESYRCPDVNDIQIRVGMTAKVIFQEVNLRSSPVVPEVWKSNILVTLIQGDRIKIIGGPVCAHDGTWWEARFRSGTTVTTGWIREMIPGTFYFKQVD